MFGKQKLYLLANYCLKLKAVTCIAFAETWAIVDIAWKDFDEIFYKPGCFPD